MIYPVIFSGSRRLDHRYDKPYVWNIMDGFVMEHANLLIRVGDARGLDWLIVNYCIENKISYQVYTAAWKEHGKRAGFLRNNKMMEDGGHECHVFFKEGAENKGTQMMITLANRYRILVVRHDL